MTDFRDGMAPEELEKIKAQLLEREGSVKKRVDWICHDCGCQYGRQRSRFATYHMGRCDVCGELESVTQGRDYGVYEVPRVAVKEGRE